MVGQTLVWSCGRLQSCFFGRVVRSYCPITPTSFYSSLDASVVTPLCRSSEIHIIEPPQTVAPLVAMASLNAVTPPRAPRKRSPEVEEGVVFSML